MFKLYILYSQTLNRFYIGHTTTDVEKRLAEHNAGISSFTSKANDWVLRYSETFITKEEVLKE